MISKSRILIVGAGGIGGIIAGLMKKNGYDVTLVCKYPELAQKISHRGLHLFGHCGDFRIKLDAFATTEELNSPFDVVFIATKATDALAATRSSLTLLKATSRLVSLQNGIMEEDISKIAGPDRTVGCVVGFGATLHAPGVIEMTSRGEMITGYLNRPADKKLSEICKMLSCVVPTRSTEQILSNLYSKLIVNAFTSTVGAISGLDLGPMLKRKRARKIFLAIGREAMEVADAMHLHVVPYANRANYYSLLRRHPIRQHLFLRLFGIKYRKLRSTNLQSLERGNRTEIDFLNGYIVRKGDAHGIETPVNKRLIRIVQEIENGRRPITPMNIEDEYFDDHI